MLAHLLSNELKLLNCYSCTAWRAWPPPLPGGGARARPMGEAPRPRQILKNYLQKHNDSTFIHSPLSSQTMHIFGTNIPDKPLSIIELARYVRLLKISGFRGVFMRDTLQYPFKVVCGIVNFNTSSQPGSHWVCYYRNKNERIYFDSYEQITPVEIQRYLKTGSECDRGKEVIQRNTAIVQAASTPVCDHLCLFVLKSLASGNQFQSILNLMQHYGYPQGDWKDSV